MSLQNELNFIDFAHVSTIFLGIKDTILKSKIVVQQKNFCKLLQLKKEWKESRKIWFWLFQVCTFRYWKEAPCERFQLKYAEYLIHFELFYWDIHNLEILSIEDLDFVKTKTKETALSSFRQYNKNAQQNLSKEEFAALTNLSKNNDIVIQK